MTELYRDYLGVDLEQPTTDVGDLSDKHGMDLVDHFPFYGASQDELENLARSQIATLELAGLLR